MAYMGRKQFEAKLIAAEVGKMLGGVAGDRAPDAAGRAPNGDKIVHGDEMLAQLGFM